MYTQAQKSIVMSVLNWNSASVTLKCIASIRALESNTKYKIKLIVTYNGSRAEDFDELRSGFANRQIMLVRQPANLGFAGGHNVVMQAAIDRNADFVWLINSDALVTPDSLNRMLALIESDPHYAAVSPVIMSPDTRKIISFFGAHHD